jgi:hypothetical protein
VVDIGVECDNACILFTGEVASSESPTWRLSSQLIMGHHRIREWWSPIVIGLTSTGLAVAGQESDLPDVEEMETFSSSRLAVTKRCYRQCAIQASKQAMDRLQR